MMSLLRPMATPAAAGACSLLSPCSGCATSSGTRVAARAPVLRLRRVRARLPVPGRPFPTAVLLVRRRSAAAAIGVGRVPFVVDIVTPPSVAVPRPVGVRSVARDIVAMASVTPSSGVPVPHDIRAGRCVRRRLDGDPLTDEPLDPLEQRALGTAHERYRRAFAS